MDCFQCNRVDPVRPVHVCECADVCLKYTKESRGSVFTGMFWPFHHILKIFPIGFLSCQPVISLCPQECKGWCPDGARMFEDACV